MNLVFHVMYGQHCTPLSDIYIVQIPPSTVIESAADQVRRKLKKNPNVYEVVLVGQSAGGIQIDMLENFV